MRQWVHEVCIRLLPFFAGMAALFAVNPGFHITRYPRYHLDLHLFGHTFHGVPAGVAFGVPILTIVAAVMVSLTPMRRAKAAVRRRMGRFARGVCVRCGYNLRGNVSGVCPECGLAIIPEAR